MKRLFTLSLLLLAALAEAQFFTEAGIAPLTSRMRQAVAVSAGFRFTDVELSAPVTYEWKHNLSAGISAGYRFPGSYVQGLDGDGVVLHAGVAYSWHSAEALKSGEVRNRLMPVVGLKWCVDSWLGESVITELRYQGGGIMVLFGFRF